METMVAGMISPEVMVHPVAETSNGCTKAASPMDSVGSVMFEPTKVPMATPSLFLTERRDGQLRQRVPSRNGGAIRPGNVQLCAT